MKFSNVLIFAFIVLVICAGAYWYQTEGTELLEQLSQSENKPFFLNGPDR